MKLYEKVFVNPLLALAFKDGVDFANDPDLKALEPKKEGPNKWIVLIEDNNEDDDDVTEAEIASAVVVSGTVEETKPAWNEARDMVDVDMTPVTPRSMQIDTVKSAIMNMEIEPDTDAKDYPCGECLNCRMGHDCIEEINEACRSYRGER